MKEKESTPVIEKAWHFPRENKTIIAESYEEAKQILINTLNPKIK